MEMGEISTSIAWLWFDINTKKVKSWKLRVFHLHLRTIDSVRVLRIYRVGCQNRWKQIKSYTLLEQQHEMLQFRNDMVGTNSKIVHIMKPINEWKYIIIKMDGVTFSSVNGLVQPLRCLHLIFSVDFNIHSVLATMNHVLWLISKYVYVYWMHNSIK